jgi:hypothetical protein
MGNVRSREPLGCLVRAFSMSAEPSTDEKRNPFETAYVTQMEHTITEKVINVNYTIEMPAGFRQQSPWPAILREYMDPLIYPYIGRRENIRPKSVLLREYNERSYEELGYTVRPRYVCDKYARIGNDYICSRSYNGRDHLETFTFPMRLTEDLKQAIVAAAMHPSRLQTWLDKGWEEEWYAYFSR